VISVKWQHRTSKSGQISFGTRARVRIVDGVFEAPDDPALTERLKKAGHTPIEDAPAPPAAEVERVGALDADGERKTDGKPKKGR
jgi:hypothetical protein